MDLARMGARIKARRETRGLTQAEIAATLQISSQAVSKWERGENAPDISVLVELTRLLDVSVEWLLGGTSAEAHTFPACVFCTSLRGFADKAAAMPPRDLASWANGIYYNLTEALLRYDGVPVKYVGDGFLGFFAGRGMAERALDAALEARNLHDNPEMIIALHQGELYLGIIGHPDHAQPDILGETVNTTFLIMPWVEKNCPGGIGLTETVKDLLPDPSRLTRRGAIQVKGVDARVSIYEPG